MIESGAKIIFQATVITEEGLLAMADVIEKEDDGWILYEIKSSSSVKKNEHIPDMAFQRIAFEKAGYKIVSTKIIHLNKEFVRGAGDIDPVKFFVTEDVSVEVGAILPEVVDQITLALHKMSEDEEPSNCPCRLASRGQHCPTFNRFNPDVPTYSVYDIARMQGKKLIELVEEDILDIKDIPDGFSLTPNQTVQVAIEKSSTPLINKVAIENELKNLEFPLYFLDYESVNPAIPLVEGIHPHQQMVFQYSLHILDGPDSTLRHTEHLSKQASTSSLEQLTAQMREDIGDTGSIIVWNKIFERDRNKELGALVPQYADFYASLNQRIYDLKDVFSNNYYVHPGFHGSNSIKDVLPVLAPQLSYKDLAIGKGDIASVRWYEIVTNENPEGADEVFSDLLAYCKLDTLAMVEIYNVLRKL